MNPRLAVLTETGTAVIADVFDGMGILPPVLDNALFAIDGEARRFGGFAHTIAGVPHAWDSGRDPEKLAAIDATPSGAVVVWSGGGVRGVCCFGDLLAEATKVRGAAGVVVDGGVRDTAFLRTLGLPIRARYRTPAQAIGRWKVTGHGGPVALPGAIEATVAVRPGDAVVADDDGVIVVPAGRIDEVAERAARWAEKDGAAREDIRRGMTLLDAIRKHGAL
jgi:regulator of RNase E activity RraA